MGGMAHVSVPAAGRSTCHVYGDRAPILSITTEAADATLVADVTFAPHVAGRVSAAELEFARELVSAAQRYAEECARWAAQAGVQEVEPPSAA